VVERGGEAVEVRLLRGLLLEGVGQGEQVGVVGQPVAVDGWDRSSGGLLGWVRQLRVLEPFAQGAGVAVLDQAQVVDTGWCRWWRGVGVGLPASAPRGK